MLLAALLGACSTAQMQLPASLRQGDATSTAPASKAPATGGTAGSAAAQLDTAGGRTKQMSSFEGDLLCTRLVAPFALSDNLAELGGLATSSALDTATTWFDNAVSGKSNRTTLTTAGAGIPREVRAAALRMNWLPMPAEVSYGRIMLDKMRDDLLERDSGNGRRLYPQADAMLAEVLKGVSETHDYRFELHIRTSAGDNAIALPGGFIVVDADLVRNLKLRQKALFAIGHEIGHVLQRHETRAAQARIIDSVALGGNVQDLLKAIRSTRGDPTPLFTTVLAGKLQFERHFADQELHADGCSVRVLDKSLNDGPQLAAVVRGFVSELSRQAAGEPAAAAAPRGKQPAGSTAARLQQSQEQMETLVTVVTRPIDRHPAPQERAANLTKTLASLPAAAPPVAPPPRRKEAPKPPAVQPPKKRA